MARKTSADPILSIDFFNSGFYSYRNPLFAPFRNIGINVVSFHDSVIDGANMEDTDTLQWTRRPGFAKFCSVQLGSAEIVNQFYSSRNLNGAVTDFFDSTTRFATFDPSSITPILIKATTDQGYMTTIGNMTYFSDGVGADMQKWGSPNGSQAAPVLSAWGLAAPTLTPSIMNVGCWLPDTIFSLGNTILDPNGSVQSVTTALGNATTSSSSPSVSTLGLAGSTVAPWFVSGSSATTGIASSAPSGYTEYLTFTGLGFSIPGGATILGVVVNIQKEAIIFGGGAAIQDQSVKLISGGAAVGTEHADTITNWSTSGIAIAEYGSSSDLWGAPLTAAYINSSAFGFAIAANFNGALHHPAITGEVGTSGFLAPTITVYYVVNFGTGNSGPNEPIWSTTVSAITSDGGLQWTNYGNLDAWFPDTYFPTPVVILDSNGNLQLATTAANPIAVWDISTTYSVGEIVTFGGTYWIAANTSTGIAPNSGYTTSTTTGGTTTTVSYWTQVNGPIQTGVVEPVWNTAIGGTTSDGGYTWTNLGQGTLIESFGTSYVFGYRTIYGHLTTSSPISVNTGSIFGAQTSSITSFAISGNTITFQGVNNFIPGNIFTTTGLSGPVASTLNGQTFIVLSSGLSTTQFSAKFLYPGAVGSTSVSGSTLNLIATVSSQGTASPLCNASVTITATFVSANVITVTAVNNFVPGLYVTFSGITVATFLNGLQLQIINVDPNGQWFQVYFQTPNQTQTIDTGTAVFNAVEIYRVSDGGGIYLFSGAVTNPGAGNTWTYNDFTSDADLNVLQIAPQANQNDPPPGAPGSQVSTAGTVTVYWQGRMWIIVGNYVYFDAGPDCTNGIPEESWPPANRFQFAGPPMNLVPTADGVGLLVYLADRVNAILGGPETISFYPTDALSNFGIANPNAIFRDGSTIGQFTTQSQYFELIDKQKTEVGEHVADYLSTNFTPVNTYATMYRNGLDVGVFLSNGVDQVLRFGSNIGAWSVPAFPVGGAGALQAIETSVGVHSLMLASPTGGGYILARNLNTWQDNGQNYPECYVTVGSITLSQPGAELLPLQHVIGYFDAVGTLNDGSSSYPQISILPNEISGTSGIGFITLPEVLQEPTEGQNNKSTTILALRFPVNMMNSDLASQFIHHLQVMISFAPENAPNTMKALAFKTTQNQ